MIIKQLEMDPYDNFSYLVGCEQTHQGMVIDPGEIIEFCRERIAGYKVPKGIDLQTDALPKSGPGKVLKRELRAPYWEGKDRAVN